MSITDICGSVERELRVEIGPDEAEAVHRCLLAQVGQSRTPDIQITSIYFEEGDEPRSGPPGQSGVELVVQWADGPEELDKAPAVVERRTRQGEWVALQRVHIPRRLLRASLRPATRAELVPLLPARSRPTVAVDTRRVLFRDPEGAFIATLSRDIRFFEVGSNLDIGRLLLRAPSAVLTVRPLQGSLPGWLEGLVKMGAPYDEHAHARRASDELSRVGRAADVEIDIVEDVPEERGAPAAVPAPGASISGSAAEGPLTFRRIVAGEYVDEDGYLLESDLEEAAPGELPEIPLDWSDRDHTDALAEDWFASVEARTGTR